MLFEDALKELEIKALKIKDENTSLEEAIKCYDEGIKCYEQCRKILDEAEQKIQIYSR